MMDDRRKSAAMGVVVFTALAFVCVIAMIFNPSYWFMAFMMASLALAYYFDYKQYDEQDSREAGEHPEDDVRTDGRK